MAPGVCLLTDAHAVDQGDEQGDKPKYKDHYTNVPELKMDQLLKDASSIEN